jgi:ubiquinone/menaquinone biosynthesis C-methylase UbiE
MADEYTHGHHESVLRSHDWRTAENSARYLLPHLAPGMSVLDVGSGPGTVTIDVARIVAPGRVVGVDAAPDVVARAAESAAAQGVDVGFEVGDGYALDAADGSFDVVHAHQVLQHVARPVDMLREFGRVAGPDGVVAVRDVDYEGVIWHPRIPALDEWLALYLPVHRGITGEPAAGRMLKSWAQQAGFSRIAASASVWLFESPDDRAWWGGMWADRVLHSSFAEHAHRLGLADTATLQRISDGWREWVAADDGWLLMPHGEVLARR